MCFSTAKWKREQTLDHKFDFIELDLFYERNCLTKVKYSFIFLLVLKSVLVYIADLWSATLLLIFSDGWTSSGLRPTIRLDYARLIYLFTIICSFLLLAWEANKARAIMRSRDIGLAFTSPFCYRFYVLRSYPHYCFFSKINDSKKALDDIAFFVFFTLKGWKRLLFAEAPRQAVNGFTMYAFLTTNPENPNDRRFNFSRIYQQASVHQNPAQLLALCSMAFAFSIFAVSALLSLLALFLYFPLLCVIRGNLKEFCCHKIDKRIGEMLRKKSRMRVVREAKLRMMEKPGEFYHRDVKNSLSLREPTLPTISPDLEDIYDFEGRLPPYVHGLPNTRAPMVPQRSTSDATFRSAGSVRNQSYASSAPTYFSRQASSVRSSPGRSDTASPMFVMEYTRSPSPHSMQRYPSKASSVASTSANVTYASRVASSLANAPIAPGPVHTVQRKPTFTNIQSRVESPHSYTRGAWEAGGPDMEPSTRKFPVDTSSQDSRYENAQERLPASDEPSYRADIDPEPIEISVPTRQPSTDSDTASERTNASSPFRSKTDVRNNEEVDQTFKSHHIFSPTSSCRTGTLPFTNSSTPHSMISFTNDASISFSFGNASVVDDHTHTTEDAEAISYLAEDPFASMEASIVHNNLSITPTVPSPTSRFFVRESPTGQTKSSESSQRRSRFGGRDGGWSDGEELIPSRYRERKRTIHAQRGDLFMTGYGVEGVSSKNVALGVSF